jgi:hypothetical protein
MEGVSIYPMAGINASLNSWDAVLKLVADVGAGLGGTKPIDIGDGVVVGIGGVKLNPTLEVRVAVAVVIVFGGGAPRGWVSDEGGSGWWDRDGVWAGEDMGGGHGREGVDKVGGQDHVKATEDFHPFAPIYEDAVVGLAIGAHKAPDI